jgi:hypothetical protein
MFASGFTNETIYDEGRCKFITEFEKGLPLKNISLIEYEQRLKTGLSEAEASDGKISVLKLVENFKTHWAFKDI